MTPPKKVGGKGNPPKRRVAAEPEPAAAPEPRKPLIITKQGLKTGQRIAELRKAKKLTQAELGFLCGLGKSGQRLVSSYERGKVQNAKYLVKLAAPLGTTVEFLVTGKEISLDAPIARDEEMIPLLGAAAAGHWIDPSLLDPPLPVKRVSFPSWPEVAQYALIAEGPSMNKFILDGTYVFCVYAAESRQVPNGKMVHAVLSRGGLEEWTIKRLEVKGNGVMELWPESHDSRFQKPMIFDPKKPMNDIKLEIRGIVLGSLGSLL